MKEPKDPLKEARWFIWCVIGTLVGAVGTTLLINWIKGIIGG